MSRLSLLSCSAIVACAVSISATACAQDAREFAIPAGSLRDALNLFATQADQQILFAGDLVAGRTTPGLVGRYVPRDALDRLLAGSGVSWSQGRPGVIFLRPASAATDERAVAVEDVIVTGTLLRNGGDTASPIVTVTRGDLDRRGYATAAEALAELPQNYAGMATPIVQTSGADRAGSNTVFATGVNLRGLGPTSTLLLVNGRRLAGTGYRAEFADASAIPSAAVDRVDVLLDGASALYGSDAVAGVVNVILKRSYEGQESRLRLSAAEGGAEDIMASHLIGRRWSSGSAYVSYEYQNSHGLSALDRAYTASGDLRPFGGTDHRGLNSAPGNILAFNPAAGAFQSIYAIRPNASGSAQTPQDFAAGDANRLLLNSGIDLLPAIERHGLYGRLSQSLGDRLEIDADLRYNRRAYDLAGAASSGVFNVTRANPFFVSPTGAASHLVGYSFLRELGPSRQSGSSESVGLTIGASYALTPVWSLDAYAGLSRETAETGVRNRTNSRFIAEALGNIPDDPATPYRAAVDGYLNLFGAGAANSRGVLDFVGGGFTDGRDLSQAKSLNALAQGPLIELPGGSLQLAVGAQLRQDTFESRTTFLGSTVTPIVTVAPARERTIAAAFGELRVPIFGELNARPGLERLDVSVAARIEDYDDIGSTTNPKVGIVWSPAETVTVRASWGTSFRAASLPQINDPAGAAAPFLTRVDGTSALTLLLVGGNADLKPEQAETFTTGFVISPTGGARLSLDYFQTDFSDRIAQPVAENINGVLSDPDLAAFVTLINPAANPGDLALIRSFASLPGFSTLYPIETYGAIVDARWVNTGAVAVRGLDLAAAFPVRVGGEEFLLDGSASYILNYDTQTTPTAGIRDVVGLTGYPVRLRARSGMSWTSGSIDAGMHWNHVASYRDRLGAKIDALNTADAQIGWSPQSGPMAGLTLNLTVQNLFDADPPFYDAGSGFGFDPGQANILGRVVALQLIRRW